ncbi:hypothetical protein GJ496_005118 [Pomphorhynchus laevis]|nr:hypothetical protein GJ496_005118 [Pomphorhynchus laevis]
MCTTNLYSHNFRFCCNLRSSYAVLSYALFKKTMVKVCKLCYYTHKTYLRRIRQVQLKRLRRQIIINKKVNQQLNAILHDYIEEMMFLLKLHGRLNIDLPENLSAIVNKFEEF